MSAQRATRLLGLLGLLGVALLAACSEAPSLGAPDPASEQGGEIDNLWRGTVLAALVVGAVVWGLIIWSIVRYRKRNDDVPDQRPHNIPIEVVYTIVPVLIVAVLFYFTLDTQLEVSETSASPDVTVEVVGFQWQWQFRYPADDVTVTGGPSGRRPEMVLPVGRTVRLKLVSADVNHSFWVPRFLSKRDLIPGVRNEIDIDTTEKGSFVGRCAEFCGLDHWRMYFSVRVVDPSTFEAWLAEQREAPG